MGEHTSHYESYSSGVRSAFRAPVRRERGVPVIEVYGEVDLATVSELRRVICGAGAPSCEEPALAVVDLREADFIDVYGVRMLIEEALASSGLGGELRLVVPAEGCVARVFELLGIGRMLDLHRDLDLRGEDLKCI